MKLTTKKLKSLILETYSKEQENKILTLIKKTRNKLFLLEEVSGFFPTLINDIYFYDDTTYAVKRATKGPLGRRTVQKHYGAMQRITQILEEVNQYMFLLESLEIQGNIAFIAQGMIYSATSGPTTGIGHSVKLNELAKIMDTGITFLEDVKAAVPGLLGEGNLGLETMRDVAESFDENYLSLKNYLDGAI